MLMRMRLRGTGSGFDPMRANFPTYGLVGVDPIAGTTVIDVPADHLPPAILADGGTVQQDTPYGKAITAMSPAMVAAWQARLAALHPNLPYQVDTTLV